MSQHLAAPPVVNQNMDPLLDLQESATYLGLKNPRTITVWLSDLKTGNKEVFEAARMLTPTRIGRRVFFRRSVLEKFIEARTSH